MAGHKRWQIAALSMVLGIFLVVPTASASPRPVLNWAVAAKVDAGAPIPISWSGRRLGRGHRLVVQRSFGTARVWRTIMRLPTNSGSAELPGLPLGEYRLRLADLSGRRLLSKRFATVAVFGPVPFSTLYGKHGESGVAATDQTSFPYVDYWEGEVSRNPILQVEHNNCEFVHIDFLPTFPGPGTTGSLTLVQESREAVTAAAARNTIGSLNAELTPGESWAVNGQAPENIHLNGYAICDSTASFFS